MNVDISVWKIFKIHLALVVTMATTYVKLGHPKTCSQEFCAILPCDYQILLPHDFNFQMKDEQKIYKM